ncbi:MAG: 3-hydroxybutyryl-CoA dehydrogenase [Myxococcales bacterium]|nr:3-hydroxybutyryl-CoA dehydrogenase [Myxococcota bacterium]MDW8281153.1 3-hydroxybutyryl-CoA dehydrogenase [Myxococcales bacterium]
MSEENVKLLGVVGAGQMGSGIAQVAAERGLPVLLCDVTRELAERGRKRIADQLDKLVHKGKITAEQRDATLGRISPCGSLEALSECDFVIEAASENQELKQQIFCDLDRLVRRDAVLASNTSSISITLLGAQTKRPEQVIGMHFMNPVPLMQLVEVIRGLCTDEATYQRTLALGRALGKEMITARDMPGFIVNRVLIPFLNEACFALQEGLGTVEDIDKGIRLGLNHKMGPFELSDLIGLDTVLAIAEVLHRQLGDDKYRPAPLLRQYVAAGYLGRKSGRGFYTY